MCILDKTVNYLTLLLYHSLVFISKILNSLLVKTCTIEQKNWNKIWFSFVFYCYLTTYALISFTGYLLTLIYFEPWLIKWVSVQFHPLAPSLIFIISCLPLFIGIFFVYKWSENNWRSHPISQKLKLFVSPESNSLNSWVNVASDINNEFRRFV